MTTPEQAGEWVLSPLEAEIEAALHHLQADGALDRSMLAETLTRIQAALRTPAPADEGRDVNWRRRYEDEYAIVDRCWKALGITTYQDAEGRAIHEIIADYIEAHAKKCDEVAVLQARLATAERAATERERAKDALCESNYIAGMKAGWNFAVTNDHNGYQSAINRRVSSGYLATIRASRPGGDTGGEG